MCSSICQQFVYTLILTGWQNSACWRACMQKLKNRWASKTCLPFGEPESAMQATQPYKSVSTFQTLRRWRLACLSCKSAFIHSISSILPSPPRLPIAPSPASNQSFWDLLYAESISGLFALIEWKASQVAFRHEIEPWCNRAVRFFWKSPCSTQPERKFGKNRSLLFQRVYLELRPDVVAPSVPAQILYRFQFVDIQQ